MSAAIVEGPRGGSGFTLALAVLSAATFGLVGGLPELAGPAIGVGGIVLTAAWRRFGPSPGEAYGPLPALIAFVVLAASSPPSASAELFGALAALALLLWLADDPARPSGGGRRAVPTLAACSLVVAVAWSLALALPRPSGAVGLAGGLLALALLVLAWLLAREVAGGSAATASS